MIDFGKKTIFGDCFFDIKIKIINHLLKEKKYDQALTEIISLYQKTVEYVSKTSDYSMLSNKISYFESWLGGSRETIGSYLQEIKIYILKNYISAIEKYDLVLVESLNISDNKAEVMFNSIISPYNVIESEKGYNFFKKIKEDLSNLLEYAIYNQASDTNAHFIKMVSDMCQRIDELCSTYVIEKSDIEFKDV